MRDVILCVVVQYYAIVVNWVLMIDITLIMFVLKLFVPETCT